MTGHDASFFPDLPDGSGQRLPDSLPLGHKRDLCTSARLNPISKLLTLTDANGKDILNIIPVSAERLGLTGARTITADGATFEPGWIIERGSQGYVLAITRVQG